jgi:DNA alkylation repair enzyme
VSDAGDFIDAALQYEVSPYSYPVEEPDGLVHYGTSVGAIRGTVRDAVKRYPAMLHDEIMALSSELWAAPIFERRQAAIVLLQSHVESLVANDLTRIEGFIRSAASGALVDELVADVVTPMLAGMPGATLARIRVVIGRWAADPDVALRSAARHIGEFNW